MKSDNTQARYLRTTIYRG